jgi:hypothetical protein
LEKNMESNVTDAEIVAAFGGTDFGGMSHRKLLEIGVLKRLVGYSCGHTLTRIMCELGLITKKETVTVKGKQFARAAYHELMLNGG